MVRELMGKVLATALLCGLAIAVANRAEAQIPRTISYQGVLTDAAGTIVPDGNYTLSLKLYDVATSGTELWSETQSVTTAKGVFTVILGNVNVLNLPFDKPYWLGVAVGTAAEMTPRVQLTASAYSMRAANADTSAWVKINFGSAGSLASGTPYGNGPGWIFIAPNGERRDIVAGNGNLILDYKLYLNKDGNVGVGTYSWPGGRLGVMGDIFVTGNLTKEYKVGSRNNATPVAFGTINSDGTIATATPNVSSSFNTSGYIYEIGMDGETYEVSKYVTVVTPLGGGTATSSYGNGKLFVAIRDAAGNPAKIGFCFVTYKP